jgi:hypothetical protein
MNRFFQLLICLPAAVVLCQCSSGEKKAAKKDTANMSLAQRSMLKPDANQRSSFEKYITSPQSKSNAGAYFQKQMHQSKSFNGGQSYAGQKQFKTDESRFGKSKAQNMDMTYALGDKRASGTSGAFKTESSRFAGKQARESGSAFSGADNVFKAGSALTRSKGTPKAPLIIENYNDRGGGKASAYTEDEVKKLLNRN